MKSLCIAVLGAGPVGVEAALYAQELGHEVTVLERGRVGENLSRWGHVTLFSPFALNHTPLGLEALKASGANQCPGLEESLTGAEHLRRYLLPLSRLPRLRDRIREGHRVVAIGKEGFLKGERIGEAARLDSPFRILADTPSGEEIFHADRVIDATGTYGNPRRLGAGGILAPGERAAAGVISHDLDDPLNRHRERYAGKRTLLVGGGYSAATSALALRRLAEEAPSTKVFWVTRARGSAPYASLPSDPLPRRAALVEEANRLASRGAGGVHHLGNRQIASLRPDRDGGWRVRLQGAGGSEELLIDRILANVGYLPDESIYSELQVHTCYASSGPMKLAAALLATGGADCLSQPSAGPEALQNPEPGLYILGAKSYGRNSAFLMRAGFDQIRDTFQLIEKNPELDLYASAARTPA